MSTSLSTSPAFRPASLDEICQIVASSGTVLTKGWGSQFGFGIHAKQARDYFHEPSVTLLIRRHKGVVEFSPHDLVVTVRAGTRLADLQEELGKFNQCIPIGPSTPFVHNTTTIGGLIAMDLPHTLEFQCGSWKDWVLRMKVVLPDGSVVQSGSNVTKNVAGFDAHKLLVGSRGTLGVISEVTLRTFPSGALPAEQIESRGALGEFHTIIQRVMHCDFKSLRSVGSDPVGITGLDDDAFVSDFGSSTHWSNLRHGVSPRRFEHDWVAMRWRGSENIQITDPTQIALMKRAKAIFDPTNKLNPGEFGFI